MSTTQLAVSTPPMRADARRNYARLVAAAKEAFTENGSDAPLDDIARRAEVGIGTLYRHFPTRNALLEAVFHDEFEALRVEADALRGSPTPNKALARWLRSQLAHSNAYRGLAASVMIALLDEESGLSSAMTEMRASGAALLAHAQKAGAVRPDLDVSTLLKLVCAIGVATQQAPDGAAQADRMLSIMLDGMRPRESNPT